MYSFILPIGANFSTPLNNPEQMTALSDKRDTFAYGIENIPSPPQFIWIDRSNMVNRLAPYQEIKFLNGTLIEWILS